MLSVPNRWRNVLKDLSFVDASCESERRKIISEISILSKAPLAEFEDLICGEFEEVAKRLRLAISATKRDQATLQFAFDIARLCEHLGKQLLVFDENSSRALISLFLDCLPPTETIKDPSYENEWTPLLDGIAAVLYQTGTFIERSIPDTKRLEILFRQLLEPDLNTEIKCLLTQVNILHCLLSKTIKIISIALVVRKYDFTNT